MLKLFGDHADFVEDDFCAYDGDDDGLAAYSYQIGNIQQCMIY